MALMLSVPLLLSLEITTTLVLWALAFYQIARFWCWPWWRRVGRASGSIGELDSGVLNSFTQVDEEGNLMRWIFLTCVVRRNHDRLIFLSGTKRLWKISWWSVPRFESMLQSIFIVSPGRARLYTRDSSLRARECVCLCVWERESD